MDIVKFLHNEIFNGLFYPVIALTASLFASFLVRSILKRLKKQGAWLALHELGPSLSDLILILGIRLAIEIAPIPPRAEKWLDGIAYFISVFIILKLVQRGLILCIEWSAFRKYTSNTLQEGFIPLFKNVITLFIFTSGTIMVLKHFNYDVMSLLAALGVGSLAVGLAAKETLANMISGFILIIDKNMRPGDRLDLTGTVGDVEEIGLRSTRLRTSEGHILIVPNAELVNSRLMNLSIPTRECSCSTQIRISYTDSFRIVKDTSEAIVKQLGGVSRKKEPWVHLTSLSDGSQLIQIGFWIIDIREKGKILSEFNDLLLSQLKEKNIKLVAPILVNQTQTG